MSVSTLHDVLSNYGQRSSDTTALILTGSGVRLSRSALYSCVVETALFLRRSGIKPGDVISLAHSNSVSGNPPSFVRLSADDAKFSLPA